MPTASHLCVNRRSFNTPAEHLGYLQREMADHHQPLWSLSDPAGGEQRQVNNSSLADLTNPSVAANNDVKFRLGGFGRFLCTIGGHDYAKQYLPPYCADMSHSPEMLLAQMDYTGVKHAVLHTHQNFALTNDFVADCVRRYPDRLSGVAGVKEWTIEKDPIVAADEVEKAFSKVCVLCSSSQWPDIVLE